MNAFEKYDSYKESGVEWLGEIPEHWKLMKLKFLANIQTGEKDTVDREDNGVYPFFVRSKDIKRINTYSYDEEAVLTAGDGDIGKIFHYINGKFEYHQRVYKFSNFKHIIGKYLFYYLHYNLEQEVVKLSAKTTVDSLRLPMLQNFNVSIPPLHEQTLIASFLDEKTAKIDEAISQKQKLIELLKERRQIVINDAVTKGVPLGSGTLVPPLTSDGTKVPFPQMKDSGVEWIGKVPKHWEVRRLASLGFFSKGGGISRDKLIENGLPAILYGDIYTKYNYYTSETKNFISQETSLKAVKIIKDDILFTGSGETKEDIGKCIVFTGNEAFAGGDIIIYKQNIADSIFLSYSLNSTYSIIQKMIMAKGEIIVHIYGSKLKDLIIFLPPKHEQLQIVEYIETQTTKIDKAIELQQNYIAKLKEYKTTLIDSVVTGKVRVV